MKIAKKALIKTGWLLLGRRNLVRLGRFISNEARLDINNALGKNGEEIVQRVALANRSQPEKTTIFDVGANLGNWTKQLFDQQASAITVHAFEPCAGTRSTLSSNLEKWGINSQVVVNPVALSSEPGIANFYSYGDGSGINGLHASAGTPLHTAQVVMDTVDCYCLKQGVSHVRLLKIDAEGHDLEIVYGAKEMLERGAIDVLQFEYNHRWITTRHYLKDAFTFFEPLKYKIGKVTPMGIEFYEKWDFELETFREANFIAVKRDKVSEFPVVQWWKS